MCYPDRSGRSQFHGMRKKKHGCHTGNAEDKPIMPASPASVKAKIAARETMTTPMPGQRAYAIPTGTYLTTTGSS